MSLAQEVACLRAVLAQVPPVMAALHNLQGVKALDSFVRGFKSAVVEYTDVRAHGEGSKASSGVRSASHSYAPLIPQLSAYEGLCWHAQCARPLMRQPLASWDVT